MLKVVDGELAHVHDGANVELVDPVYDLVDAKNRPFTVLPIFIGDVFSLHLFFVIFGVFLPIIER